MADNTVLNAGSGGDTIATDDIAGIKYPRTKVSFGADGSATDVSAAAPLPVILSSNSGVDVGDVTVVNGTGANSVPVQGAAATDAAVAGNPVLIGGRASAASPTDMSADGDAAPLWLTLKGALNIADGGGTLSIDDGGGAITVDGTVAISSTVTVDGSGVTQPVSGTVTANLSATDNAVLDSIQAAVEIIDNPVVADDAAFTPATTSVMMAGFEYDDTTPDSVDEGDAGAARMSANRNIYVQLRDAAGNERGLNVDASGRITTVVASADLGTIAGAVSGTEMQVDVVTSALPTGASTAANQTTIIGHLDGVEGLLTTIDADTGNAVTALQLIDDTVFADDAAFTLASSKVQMVGAIRDDTLSTLTAIEGDAVPLRVSSTGALHVTGAGGGTQYNVDDVAGATDTGTMILAVRDDSLATLTPVDGDYVPLRVSSTGALHVTGGGGGTEYNEDAATPATITGTATMMERDDALATVTPIEGDWVSMRATAEGALWVQDFNSDAILADTANMDTNLTTIAGAVSGTEMQVDVVTSALPTGAATAANQSTIIGHVDGIEALLTTIDADTSNLSVVGGGTEAAAIRVTIANNSTGVLSVDDNGGSLTIDNAGITTIAGAVSGTEMQVDVVASLPAGTNSIGNVGIVPRTSGGMTIFRSIDIDETEEEVKATAGQLFSISAFNTTAAPLYLKFYNATAANVTVGTTTPVLTFVVPGNADSDGAGFVWNNDIGFAFGTAITVACTTGVADNDTGAPGANACIINLGYA